MHRGPAWRKMPGDPLVMNLMTNFLIQLFYKTIEWIVAISFIRQHLMWTRFFDTSCFDFLGCKETLTCQESQKLQILSTFFDIHCLPKNHVALLQLGIPQDLSNCKVIHIDNFGFCSVIENFTGIKCQKRNS